MYTIIGVVGLVALFWFVLVAFIEYRSDQHQVKKFKQNLNKLEDEKRRKNP